MNPTNHKTWLLGGVLSLGAYWLLRSRSPLKGLGVLTSRLDSEEVNGTIRRLSRDLGPSIQRAANLTSVPTWLITVISAHEIRFRPYATVNPTVGATGPMQMTPDTLFDTYFMAHRWGLLSPGIETYFRQQMGLNYERFWTLAKDRRSDKLLAKKYLLDSSFNMVAGALWLRCLLHLCATPSGTHQAWLTLGYNQGPARILRLMAKQLGSSEAKLISQIAQATHWQLPAPLSVFTDERVVGLAPSTEAKAYIPDMIGVGGYFQRAYAASMQNYSL